jgi:hypothetical protein
MEHSLSFQLGKACGFALFAFLPLLFLVNSFKARSRSLRLANLALFCGTSLCIMPEAYFAPLSRPIAIVLALVRFVVAVTGIVLAILALVQRNNDHGTGIARSVTAMGFSALHLLMACGLSLQQTPLFAPIEIDPRNTWVYTDPTHHYDLRLPSDSWKQFTDAKGKVSFGHRSPEMTCQVTSVKMGQTLRDYQAEAQRMTAYMDSTPVRKASSKHREGTTDKGNPFTYSTCMDTGSSGGQVFVAGAVVFCQAKGLVVQFVFEGRPRMASKIGQDAEMKSFHTSAEYILLSVE